MAFKKLVIINCQGHLLGRLASVVAKELLKGQKIVCVRCEDLNISGSLHRNKLKYKDFLRLRMNSNPKRGPFHFRAPSRIFWRTVRGMIKHKTIRGKKALSRLEVFEGVPTKFETKKKLLVPAALRTLRLKPGRDFCKLGNLSSEVGWSKGDLIKKLEDRRKKRSAVFFAKKKQILLKTNDAAKEANKQLPKESLALLQQCGFA